VSEPCALCGATWGGWRGTFEGKDLNFCCDACGTFYGLAVGEVKRSTGWPVVDRLFLEEVHGLEAEGWAEHAGSRLEFHVEGLADGSKVTLFRPTGPPRSAR
jgi:hypothetical protein